MHLAKTKKKLASVKVTWVTLQSLETERQGTFVVWTHLTSMTLPHGCCQTGLG